MGALFVSMTILLIAAVCAAWLLPNHYPPWNSFHNEATAAIAFLATCLFLLCKRRVKMQLDIFSKLTILIIGYCTIQFILLDDVYNTQLIFPLVYLTLFVLATGTASSQNPATNNIPLLSVYIYAIIFAALTSVFLQLQGWLGQLSDSGIYDIFSMGLSGDRPYGNLGQPNLLATLLIWAIICMTHLSSIKVVSAYTTTACVIVFCFGIALTQSRSAIVGIILIFLASTLLYRKSDSKLYLPFFAGSLFVLISFRSVIPQIEMLLMLSNELSPLRELTSGGIRLVLWRGLIDASLIHPFLGWGLREIHPAIFSGVAFSSQLGVAFGHSHNIIIDLIIWFGYPVTMALLAFLLYVAYRVFHLKSLNSTLLLCVFCTTTLLSHSLFEFPYQYLYFLIPAGIFLGTLGKALQENDRTRATISIPFNGTIIFFSTALTLALFIFNSYLSIENQFRALRMEDKSIGQRHEDVYKESFIFDQLSDFIAVTRRSAGLSSTEGKPHENDLLRVIYANPTPLNINALVLLYDDSGETEKAEFWRRKGCLIRHDTSCRF